MNREEAILILKELWKYEHVEYEDCEVRAAIDMAIEALAQEPCKDCISRQAVLDVVSNPLNIRLEKIIKKLPPVAPAEKVGHWIYTKAVTTGEILWSECSECKSGERGCAKRMKYCPSCGCRMTEVSA